MIPYDTILYHFNYYTILYTVVYHIMWLKQRDRGFAATRPVWLPGAFGTTPVQQFLAHSTKGFQGLAVMV